MLSLTSRPSRNHNCQPDLVSHSYFELVGESEVCTVHTNCIASGTACGCTCDWREKMWRVKLAVWWAGSTENQPFESNRVIVPGSRIRPNMTVIKLCVALIGASLPTYRPLYDRGSRCQSHIRKSTIDGMKRNDRHTYNLIERQTLHLCELAGTEGWSWGH